MSEPRLAAPTVSGDNGDASRRSSSPPRRVFITVAEVSGDQHAAHLVRSLKELDPGLIIEGLGGPEMRAAGVIVHHETVGNAAMGLSGAKRIVEMFGLLRWTRRYFREHPPDLQICCDSP